MPVNRILIVGGSTRAAANSVRRAGWHPVCADLFADLDLRQSAEVIPVRSYPDSLPEDVANVRADGWFYCGALENHPEILERMLQAKASYGPLLGTPPTALKLVRDPQSLAQMLHSTGIGVLEIASESSPPTPDGGWLQKPLASAGGRAMRVWDQSNAELPFPEPHYFQRRALGTPLSAIFRAGNGRIEWLGASQELESNPGSHPPTKFSYCGSCGPLKKMPCPTDHPSPATARFRIWHSIISSGGGGNGSCQRQRAMSGSAVYRSVVQRQLDAIARVLVRNVAGLNGLVGLDFRLNGETIWLTEINPRYTASVEILELASGKSFLNRNAANVSTAGKFRGASKSIVIAKQILYAAQSLIAPDFSRYLKFDRDPWDIPILADIPFPGSLIESGWPICTVMAGGATAGIVETILRDRVATIRSEMIGKPKPGKQ